MHEKTWPLRQMSMHGFLISGNIRIHQDNPWLSKGSHECLKDWSVKPLCKVWEVAEQGPSFVLERKRLSKIAQNARSGQLIVWYARNGSWQSQAIQEEKKKREDSDQKAHVLDVGDQRHVQGLVWP